MDKGGGAWERSSNEPTETFERKEDRMCFVCNLNPAGSWKRAQPSRRQFLATAAMAATARIASPALAQDRTADLIIENARIVTLDRARPSAEAIAIGGDQILAVGSQASMQRWKGTATRVVDAGGRTIVPGLNDSHTHMIRGGLTYSQELRWDGVPSLALALQMLRAQALRTPAPHWVQVVGGWSPAQFAEKRQPTLAEINAATGDVPCFVMLIYDRAFLNKAAMRVLGYTKETQPPTGGYLERDGDGLPTGLIVNLTNIGALLGVFARIPKLPAEEQIASTRLFMRELNRLGVTSVIDAGGGGQNYPENYQAIAQLAADKALTLRIGYSLFAQHPGTEVDDYRLWSTQVKPGDGDDYFRMLGAGEYMVWAMHDAANFAKEIVPPPAIAEDRFAEAVKIVAAKGWPFRLHANYDVTAARIASVLERVHQDVPIDRLRWVIDHAETIQPATLERVAKLGGSIAIQNRMSLDGEPFIAKWGAEAAQDAPPVGRMREMGIHVASGTDGNRASSHNPWVGVQWLITGKTQGGLKHQADRNLLDRTEALRLYSEAGAWLTREEDRKGTLSPGKWADLAVLSDDYMSMPVEQIGNLSSVLTLVGGKPVHGAGEFAALAPAAPGPSRDWLPVGAYPSWQKAELQGDSRHLARSVLAGAVTPSVLGRDGTVWEMGCLCGVI